TGRGHRRVVMTQQVTRDTGRVVRDRMDDSLIDVPPGLAGVVAAETAIGDVRGLEGFYHYRQYSAVELALAKSFEEVWHLMLKGALPTEDERQRFSEQVRAARRLPDAVRAQLP